MMSKVKEIFLQNGRCERCRGDSFMVLTGNWIEMKAKLGQAYGTRRCHELFGKVCMKCEYVMETEEGETFDTFISNRRNDRGIAP